MPRDTEYISAFNPNTGKYGPEKTPYLNTFHVVSIVSVCAYDLSNRSMFFHWGSAEGTLISNH